MTYKKDISEQAGTHLTERSPRKVAKASSSKRQIQPSMGTKHRSSDHAVVDDVDEAVASDRSKKRRKFNSNTRLDHHDLPSLDTPEATTATVESRELVSDTSTQELPPEVRQLSSKYDFTTMSILSSARINDKVKNLLLRVEKFSFADPKSKPGIVILHAKSEVASKMISIVQIAKNSIEHDKGKWWQYSKLNGRIAELKAKPVKRRDDGKTLSEWQKERAGGGPEEFEDVGGETGRASKEVQHDHEVGHEDEEMEDAFESMVNPKEADQGAKQSGNGSARKIRSIPVMTIYFARVPVPGLKELYGYVHCYFLNYSH